MSKESLVTTAQWWEKVSNNDALMVDWLQKQYHGEITAAQRIRELLDRFQLDGIEAKLITLIAEDEENHAEWVKGLLTSRGITAEVLAGKQERYWETVQPDQVKTFEEICAIGHLAETMRLDRIRLLASDDRFSDIAEVFQRILPDEIFHAKAFKSLTTPGHIEQARFKHEEGKRQLGLEP
jgi:rubrerythrin